MKQQYQYLFFAIAAVITIYGLVTGKFLFLLLMFPLGLGFFKKEKDNKGN